MKKHSLLLALALLFGAKAFAQEWEWDCPTAHTMIYESAELSDGDIMVMGHRYHDSSCGLLHSPTLWKLDSEGNGLAFSDYHKNGYYGYPPYVLENGSGDVYALMTYSPDHDTCSSNYFKNFKLLIDTDRWTLYYLGNLIFSIHHWQAVLRHIHIKRLHLRRSDHNILNDVVLHLFL